MKLATIRTGDSSTVIRIDGERAVDLGIADVGELLCDPDWRTRAGADGAEVPLGEVDYAPLIPRPSKVVCVGLNYKNHIEEMGRELPEYPTIFSKWTETLIGARDDIALPPESDEVDWEVELAVVIGKSVRRADEQQAAAAIAGFAVLNDTSMRDWQRRTAMWDQGKNFEHSTPLGPWLVTPDELPGGVRPTLAISCTVNDDVRQSDNTGDLVFDPIDLVRYVSTFITLQPGDVIASGTPGGVGLGMQPPTFLNDGDVVTCEIEHLGSCVNKLVAERP
ncbi:2-hydroxyhepta-2,4-diene-1,7-dioate isomerase [Enemella dayhoffiae]|uniref:2-hydroxyhepta-2,4-diene-1,7-dioate isomerase n=1 Tax=Enemella dayhoffiae TaxID=2016507 RepID=A0A255H203_9ACTN|nr:fumarylacetoacetate hydrolase family protein [Enemella dayhoffiae]OYO21366.1 2-hydroxyhepta-2,4-diene-1,7-dioate isomerase [Enemella dayhoffiae]